VFHLAEATIRELVKVKNSLSRAEAGVERGPVARKKRKKLWRAINWGYCGSVSRESESYENLIVPSDADCDCSAVDN